MHYDTQACDLSSTPSAHRAPSAHASIPRFEDGGGALEDQKFRVTLSYMVNLRPTWATKPTEMLWL